MRALSRLFRRLFVESMEKAFDAGQLQFFSALEELRDPTAFRRLLGRVRSREWVVYAKKPFAGPQQVLDYVGRYTHRVAISNNRILNIEDGLVTFRYKDYRDGSQQRTMTLAADEFIRRFLLHVLPEGFHRIRYYGFFGARYRKEKLEQCRQLLGMVPREPESNMAELDYRDRYQALTGSSLWECPACHRGRMIVIREIPPRSIPTIPDTS